MQKSQFKLIVNKCKMGFWFVTEGLGLGYSFIMAITALSSSGKASG
jgi:hypothetical protein